MLVCNEEEKDMTTDTVERPIPVIQRITKALTEVEMIQKGKLPKKTARDFLSKSRNK